MFERDIATEIQEALRSYPVVTIVGPRQSGKTTIVERQLSLPVVLTHFKIVLLRNLLTHNKSYSLSAAMTRDKYGLVALSSPDNSKCFDLARLICSNRQFATRR